MHLIISTEKAIDIILSDEYGKWSPAGARALVEWLEQRERDFGVARALDVAEIRGEFAEYKSAFQAAFEYGWIPSASLSPAEGEADALQWLDWRTDVCTFQSGILIRSF